MSQHRDPVVADALRRLDVPDHAPDFWDVLDAQLAGGTPDTDAGEEATVVDLERSAARHATGRRRAPMLALAAAVAIVVALVVGAAVLSGGGEDESQVDMADDRSETSEPEVAPPPDGDDGSADTTAPQTTTSVTADELAAEAEEAAAAWIDALFAGDAATAYDLLDERSKAELSPAEFEELSSGLFEGAAAFAGDGIDRDVTAVPGGEGVLHVVTFAGDVEREGTVETAAYPVVVTGTGVHFTLEGPQLELDPEYAQGSGSTLASPLELLVGEEADALVWFDGGEPRPLPERGQVSIDVEAEAGPGTHVVSLVAVQGDRITARAYTVVVP